MLEGKNFDLKLDLQLVFLLLGFISSNTAFKSEQGWSDFYIYNESKRGVAMLNVAMTAQVKSILCSSKTSKNSKALSF